MTVSSVSHPIRDQAVYYTMKGAGAALVAGGVALAVAGSIYTWPIVTKSIASAVHILPSEAAQVLGAGVVSMICLFIGAIQTCSRMRGDIGSFCLLGVVIVGAVVFLGPVLIAYGLPTLGGSLVGGVGALLWTEADKWRADQ